MKQKHENMVTDGKDLAAAFALVNACIEHDPTMQDAYPFTMDGLGLKFTDYGNWRYDGKQSYNRINQSDLYVMFYNLDLPATLKDCENLPKVSNEWGQYYLVKHGSWNIKLYEDGIKVDPAYTNIINIPKIPYNSIEAIELDFFVDHSKLVSIWLRLKGADDTLRLPCYKF